MTLVLGGARSGKSARAEALIAASGLMPVYIATAEPLDAEMGERIRHHRARRGSRWTTIEEPLELARTLRAQAGPERAVLVDCLTLWLTNVMLAGRDVDAEIGRLADALGALPGPVVLVSNEVGLGIVPLDAMSRAFVDHAGRLHQRIAAIADWVQFVAAGLPLDLKTPGMRPG
ncbi:bifunctional adenosylcobinamide kinase/adenosylcobinamide-phosphate guanylyltransferase [Benzoatithermus flavus]|uniref:Bifunctional adenosylcobalamin biosynthesis protein n=1 Tax=Benzoatithermus flavus TaxID=3108223 RepID=A0ABU8XWU1_9PROT